jgi:hypothetical protein
MVQTLYYSPGQQATIILEIISDGYRANPPTLPLINRIIYPGLTLASGFPQYMTQIDTGLYRFIFTLPTGAASVGTYLVDGYYIDPSTLSTINALYQVVVTAPFGIYSATV